ncbi:hypothetical protein IT575_11110 [bacterium]|nr:hypothetical protein [bacterium]
MICKRLSIAAAALLLAAGAALPALAEEADRTVDGGGVKSEITSPRDHASGLPTGRRMHIQEQISGEYDSILAELKLLREAALRITGQAEELARLNQEAGDAAEEEADAVADRLAQIDSAEQIFNEQVAPLLDEKLTVQISQEIALTRRGLTATGNLSDGNGNPLDENLQLLRDAIAALEGSLSDLEGAAQQGKSTPVTRSNISNN